MKRMFGAAALSLVLASPASAIMGPVPVFDTTEILKTIQVVTQTAQLVTAAQTNLRALAGGGANITGVQARIANVTSLLQQAQATCQGALTGRTLPSACMVRTNVANAQAAQLGASMASIQGLQAAASGSPGSLAVGQAQAQATVEVATQLQQIHQMQLAEAQQKQIDGQASRALMTTSPAP